MEKESPLAGKVVLVVDDEPDVLDTVEEALDMCLVHKAGDYDTASQYLLSYTYDIVILDIMGVKGYKLLGLASDREVITIMLTAHSLSPEDVVKSYKKGAAFYVPKDEITNIGTFLNDVLEAKEKGKHSWSRWLERLGNYFARKFGSDWQDHDKGFWENIARYGPY